MTAPLPVIAEEARIAVIMAQATYEQALANRAEAARRLNAVGVGRKDIALLLQLTPQRVSKILDGNSPPRYRLSTDIPKGTEQRCDKCDAQVGELCRTKTGQPTYRPHRDRKG